MKNLISVAAVATIVAGCASTPGPALMAPEDPYEESNRRALAFNVALDRTVIGPAAGAYESATPRFARDRVRDFFGNLRSPVTFVNDVLQAQPGRAGRTAARFVINSTIGAAGLFDVATQAGLEGHREDFGQTLAVWGIESGPYLVVPVLGPSTPRDLTGTVVDFAFSPLTYIVVGNNRDIDTTFAISSGALRGLNARVAFSEQFESLQSQPEPYVALRRIYISERNAEIRNRELDEDTLYDDLPDFDEFGE